MKASDITPEKLEAIFKKKGYEWYSNDDTNYNLNLVGIRTNNLKANSFDDFYVIAWKYQSVWNVRVYQNTTDPGLHWLLKLLNSKGCAILVPGQYKGVYALRLHRGKYEALCQTHGPVKVYRDNDRDNVLDMDPRTIDSGDFGINHHHAEEGGITSKVDSYSAGCQVFANYDDFIEAREIWRKARDVFGNKFTYTLIEEKDFQNL